MKNANDSSLPSSPPTPRRFGADSDLHFEAGAESEEEKEAKLQQQQIKSAAIKQIIITGSLEEAAELQKKKEAVHLCNIFISPEYLTHKAWRL